MRANVFLWVNGIIIAFISLRILAGLRRAKPTTLKMDATGGAEIFHRKIPQPSEGKSLNCIFQFNGHDWDAFQVLGVPAGSSKEACSRAFHDLKRNSGEESADFLNSAWSALERYFEQV